MKNFGLVGGIGPESTVEYYLQIIKKVKEIKGTNPDFLIKSIDTNVVLAYAAEKRYKDLVAFLKEKINVLEKANADFAAMASNTPHVVYEELSKEITIPLISIVEETCKTTKENNLKKVALFGTMSTMVSGFYQKKAKEYGIEVIAPTQSQMEYIHEKYMKELLYRDIKQTTKEALINIVNDLYDKHAIEGLILGGTEIPLILNQDDFKTIKVMDTTEIHVDAIVKMMLSTEG
ncbi:aspartate/glutamate racemase family protein [Tenacibaculum sp. M341]|uniref:aspartate/glutamate racemase family protein n=1 Tax=Tenacibaculum sp. M341 TaxID=2530339 RepID=UPI0010530595|nr:amino acid racemase [Tenacibaculum sp. M341]TCI90751.1 amino acid racemase [Tenacibaculum sp. M341]